MLIPNIELKNGMWNGKMHLEYWNNFFKNKEDIDLNIGGDSKVDKLEESHKNGYEYISSNQEELLNLILKELLIQYPTLQEDYGYDDEELEEIMPNVEQILDFRKLLKPKRIYILNVQLTRRGRSAVQDRITEQRRGMGGACQVALGGIHMEHPAPQLASQCHARCSGQE